MMTPQPNQGARSTRTGTGDSHAVARCQVSVQEVAPAEVFHAQGDVNHELQECLSGQKLGTNTHMQ